MSHRRFLVVGCVAVLFAVLASAMSAQSTEGRIVGVVRDEAGAVVPQVNITVTDEARGLIRTTTTSNLGDYTVTGLLPGTYRVSGERQGFRAAVVTSVVVEVNQTLRIDLTLTVGAVMEEVTVEAGTAMLESETSALGQVIHSREMTDIPLNGRNYIQLALLSSGVVALPEGGFSSQANARTNRANSSVIIGGNRETNTSWLLDGVESRNSWTGWADLLPSVDAIREFKIQKNNYAAEFGNATGVVNVAMKSGTNDFHGSVFYFIRNDKLDARNFFDRDEPPPYRQNQWGVAIGGPIVRDRTFFFGAYESLRSRREITIRSSFPDPVQLAGDFIAVPTTIFDPTTGSVFLCGLMGILCPTPFAGNIIPPTRLNPIAQNIAAFWPAPNISGDPVVNHITTGKEINDFDQFHIRVDHHFSDRDQLFARYSFSDSDNANPGAAPFFGQIFPQTPQNLAVSHMHIFNPSWLNEFRFGYNRNVFSSVFERAPSNLGADAGLQNLDNVPAQGWGLPSINMTGFFTGLLGGLGPPTPNSQFYRLNAFQLVDHMSIIRGRHTIKTGVDIRRIHTFTVNGVIINGSYTFLGFYTGSALADFLLGLPFVGVGAQGVAVTDFRSTQWSAFVQDDIRVGSRLTLNLGLRYDYFAAPVEARDNVGLWEEGQLFYVKDVTDSLPPSLRPLAQGGGVSRGIREPDRNNFGPRFGFAVSATAKTIIRGGYGVFYVSDAGGISGQSNFSAQQPPFVNLSLQINNIVSPAFSLNDFLPDPTTLGTLAFFTDSRHNRSAYVQQWNLGIQRELPVDILFEVAYAGQVGHKLWKRHNANQAVLGTTPIGNRVPYPVFTDVLSVNTEANSNYHALQLRADKRFSHGLSFLASYTWSKSIDNSSGTLEATDTLSRLDRRLDRAVSDFDVPHQFALSYVYELPFGSGQYWGANATGITGKLISGWQLNGITTFSSGTPFSVNAATTTNTYAIFGVNRADRVCDGNLPSSQRKPERWFDTSCFIDHPANEFGDSGRNIIRQDGRNVWDIALIKNTTVGERVTLQFRTEFFNAFNHSNFARPGLGVGTSLGVVTQNLRGAGRSREIQFGLKILF